MSDFDNRLPTELWVDAHLKQCTIHAIHYYVIKKGCPIGGTVMIKQNGMCDNVQVISQARDLDGKMFWFKAFNEGYVDEKRADEYIQRAISRDPDLWVIEIEDKNFKNPFETTDQ